MLARQTELVAVFENDEVARSPRAVAFEQTGDMGIKGLTKLLSDHAPGCMREQKFESYLDRKVAIDASMHIYQFMMVIGRQGDQTLTNDAGEVTSHLQGMFMRTCRMLEAGIKPVYVFDGKPPTMKGGELAKRKDKRDEAEAALAKAKEAGDQEEIEKMSKRTVRVTRQQSQEVMQLARLMGLPVFEAPCEAEASCAALCKAGLVYAAASEDMDTLCFACPKLARNLMSPASQGKPILEFDYEKILTELDMTWEQFIDVCILCGCDYCDSIKGVGPVKAVSLIKKHGNIETLLQHLDTEKYPVPEDWPYKEARELFKHPDVVNTDGLELKWTAPDEEGIVAFLVGEKQFGEERVRNTLKKLKAAKGKSSQNRLESFFGAVTVKSSTTGKRKEQEKGKGKGGNGLGKKSKGVMKRK
jgi:flap endonuclease-1|tara:strand:- start:1026 stop:2270 length:1245 start_codon:yes stop_codon:yes gene_type:complete|eukprot:30918-Pelagococcus_subviridis.AAC.60